MGHAMTGPAHHRIPDPEFRWPASGWWFTAIGALIGGVFLVAPGSIELPVLGRLLVCMVLMFTPAIGVVLRHIWRRDRAFARRARAYGVLVTSLGDANYELDRANSVINELVRERHERSSLRIAYCYLYDGNPMIALERKRGFRVKVGDSLTVVDLDAGRVLGTFEVTEDGGNLCRARSSGSMDALWLGYMKKSGPVHSEPPPNALAIRLSVEENGDAKENAESTI